MINGDPTRERYTDDRRKQEQIDNDRKQAEEHAPEDDND